MLKYFYNLYFQYVSKVIDEKDNSISSFNIGYFSSEKKAKEVIALYKNKPGFKDYDIKCFQMQKTGVKFSSTIKSKEDVTLYVLSHEIEIENGECEWTIFGAYSSEESANNEKFKQQNKRKYKKHLNGFAVQKWEVNKSLEWKEGFESY